MSDIQTITKLRELTGAGIVDCKKALDEAGDDIDKAVELLRKKGEAKAAKKADRVASEGIIAMKNDDNNLAVVALACETDFVSRNEDFIASVDAYAEKLLGMDLVEFKTWASEEVKKELVVKIGENIVLSSADKIELNGKTVGKYIHSNKKIASVVVLEGGSEELAKDIAMHVTAMQPEYLNSDAVPSDVLDKEKEIYAEQLKTEGKPEEIIEKILIGKVNKFYEENCLVNQMFIKDDKKTITQILKEGNATLKSYQLYKI
jgi:elongation factor Ts